jgi:hypothetical protein
MTYFFIIAYMSQYDNAYVTEQFSEHNTGVLKVIYMSV